MLSEALALLCIYGEWNSPQAVRNHIRKNILKQRREK